MYSAILKRKVEEAKRETLRLNSGYSLVEDESGEGKINRLIANARATILAELYASYLVNEMEYRRGFPKPIHESGIEALLVEEQIFHTDKECQLFSDQIDKIVETRLTTRKSKKGKLIWM
jgi:hypothetical protein